MLIIGLTSWLKVVPGAEFDNKTVTCVAIQQINIHMFLRFSQFFELLEASCMISNDVCVYVCV